MHKWWPKTGGSLFKQLNSSKTATRKLTSGRLYYLTSSPLLDLHSSHKSFKHFETNNPLPVVGMIKWLWGLTDRFSWHQPRKLPSIFFVYMTPGDHIREARAEEIERSSRRDSVAGILSNPWELLRDMSFHPTVVIHGVVGIKLQTCYYNQGRLNFLSKLLYKIKKDSNWYYQIINN